jgi:hypothetical protein
MLTWILTRFFTAPPIYSFKVIFHNHEVARCTTLDAAEQVVNDMFEEEYVKLNHSSGCWSNQGISKSKFRKQFRGSFHIKPIT